LEKEPGNTLTKVQDREVWIYGPEWQRETAERIKATGYVPLSELPVIMAFDEAYENRYGELSKRLGNHPCKTLDFTKLNARYQFWEFVILGLAPGAFREPADAWKPTKIPFPPTYKFNNISKRYEKLTGPERLREGVGAYVKSKDLHSFFNSYGIPLPLSLFEDEDEEENSSEKEPHARRQEKRTALENYPEEVISLILKIKPEIEKLYELMKSELDDTGDKYYILQIDDATARAFDKETFRHIKKKHLKSLSIELVTTPAHQRRDFIGHLCRVIINDKLPVYLPHLKKVPKYGVKALFDCFMKIDSALPSPPTSP
jgi:hypothetical protein